MEESTARPVGALHRTPDRQWTGWAETALRREQDFSRAILETSRGLIVMMDTSAHILVFNRGCQELTGWSEEEVRGRKLWEVLAPEYEHEDRQRRFALLKEGRISGGFESHWRTRSGDERLISWQTAILYSDDGLIEGVVGTGIDITEKRAAELALERERQALRDSEARLALINAELEQRVAERTAQLMQMERLALMGAITAGLVHEVRNPLITLSGYHRLARRAIEGLKGLGPAGDVGAAVALLDERFTTAETAAGAVVDILENMLAFARKEGKVEQLDLEGIARELLRLMGAQLSGIRVRLDTAGMPVPLKGVKTQVLQVLLNLMTNACQALAGAERAEIELRIEHGGGGSTVWVIDNGPGVAEEHRGQLFRPFFTTRSEAGTGLGLMISRHIVESMGGTLSYRGEDGGGARFAMDLPAAR